MAATQGSSALYADLKSWYNSFNSFITRWNNLGGSQTTLTTPSVYHDLIRSSHINTLNEKINSFRNDTYLGTQASFWPIGSVEQYTPIQPTSVSNIITAIGNMSKVVCHNRAANSSGTLSKSWNSNTTCSSGTNSCGSNTSGINTDVMYSSGSNSNGTNNNGSNSNGTNSSGNKSNGTCTSGTCTKGSRTCGTKTYSSKSCLSNTDGYYSSGYNSNGTRSYGYCSSGTRSCGSKSCGTCGSGTNRIQGTTPCQWGQKSNTTCSSGTNSCGGLINGVNTNGYTIDILCTSGTKNNS